MKAVAIVPQFEISEPSPLPVRRRLAENVVCMYAEEKEPVKNIRWHGRFPACVVRMAAHARMTVGAIAEMHGGCMPENVGKLVRVITNVPDQNGCIKVEAMFGKFLAYRNIDTGQCGSSKRADTNIKNLRRVWQDRK